MYFIIWEYQVKEEHVATFEDVYSSSGAWAGLFQKSPGFLNTELLRDEKDLYRYISIDRWESAQDYKQFMSDWIAEYEALDAQCEHLTEQEMLLCKGESVLRETR